MRKKLFYGLFFLLPFAISGCSPKQMVDAAIKVGQVMWDPSVQIGEKDEKDQPSQVALSLYAVNDVNPNPHSAPPQEPEEISRTFSGLSEDEIRVQMEAALAEMEFADAVKAAELAGPRDKVITLPCESTCVIRVYQTDTKSQVREAITTPAGVTYSRTISTNYSDEQARSDQQLGIRTTINGVQQTPQHGTTTPSETAVVQERAGSDEDRFIENSSIVPAYSTGDEGGQALHLGQYSPYGQPPPLVVQVISPPQETVAYSPEMARAIATPVSFKVLQLKDDSLFLDADFDSLDGDMKKALGSTYISVDDYVLRPGQFKFIPTMEIDKNTRYIAVYAQFHEMNGAVWKGVVQIEPKGKSYNLIISFQGTNVTVQHEGAVNGEQ